MIIIVKQLMRINCFRNKEVNYCTFRLITGKKLTIIIYMQQTPGQLQDDFLFYLKGIVKFKENFQENILMSDFKHCLVWQQPQKLKYIRFVYRYFLQLRLRCGRFSAVFRKHFIISFLWFLLPQNNLFVPVDYVIIFFYTLKIF